MYQKLHSLVKRLSGCPAEPAEPEYPSRAWVIRLPGVFIGENGDRERGSFQTIVMAPTADYAWEIAMNSDVWTRLPFQVKNASVFPKNPMVTTNGDDSTR